jgi:hypothetical protein
MKHNLRLNQVFTISLNNKTKKSNQFMIYSSDSKLNLTISPYPSIITSTKTETMDGGWTRKVKEETDFTVKDEKILNSKWKVIFVSGSQSCDCYSEDAFFKASRVGGKEILTFRQEGFYSFTDVLVPDQLTLVSGPEDKYVELKQVWVEDE